MTIHLVSAPVTWLTCDVAGCREATDTAATSEGRALNDAVSIGWRTLGPRRHLCPTRDHAHEEAARRFADELAREVKP